MDAYYGLFQALFDVSLQLAPAQTLALIGSNGAGKTTLLRTLA
ncbi:ATP-binding cassette domain-containing protein, partial [Curvibacter lanceolatus]